MTESKRNTEINKNKIHWLDNADGLFLMNFGLCLSEKAWKKEMKRLKENEPYPNSSGNCLFLPETKDHYSCVIISLHEKVERCDETEILGLIVHEVTHLVDFIFKYSWGEENPSLELRAYTTQYFFQKVYEKYKECHSSKSNSEI